jgi:hypothetical protein
MNIEQIVVKLLKTGLSVIPVNSTKSPSVPQWGKWQVSPMSVDESKKYFKDAWGVAILTGGPSRVFCIDFDLKYDITNFLWNDFKKSIPAPILEKAWVQKTMNNGYHMVFLAPTTRLNGNQKWAERYTTPSEQRSTYDLAWQNKDTRNKALRIAYGDKSRVLIETRSGSSELCKGFFLCPPSPGYEKIFGDKFNELSEQEYDLLEEVGRSFNEVIKEDTKNLVFDNGDWSVTPFEHYNQEGDSVELLQEAGWSVISENSNSIRFKRPGLVYSASSALYDKETRILSCFTSSTEFDVKSYNAVGVASVLLFESDYSKTYNYLVKNGYGKK